MIMIMISDYIIDVVAGSKACIAGYSAVQAYITNVWVYYKHKRSGKKGGRKEGKGMGEKGERKEV